MPRTRPAARSAARPRAASPTNQLSAKLEEALRPLDAELAALPVVVSLHKGTVTREDYVRVLQHYLVIHQCVERALGEATHLKGLDRGAWRRGPALLRDLRILRGRIPVRTSAAVDEFESSVRAWSRAPCASLAGTLYVFERERRKAARLPRALAVAMKLKVAPLSGLDYHIENAGETARRLDQLRGVIDTKIRDAARGREVYDGAVQTLKTLVEIHRELGEAPPPR